MKNEQGFTLIEAIISLAILSVMIIGFTGAYSQGFFLIGEGRNLTKETFQHQEQMELELLEIKTHFTEHPDDPAADQITVFQGSNYETEIPLMAISQEIRGNRRFEAYVSSVEIGKPKPPELDLNIGVYANNNWTVEVFPWIDDDIEIRAEYNIHSNPPVFLSTARWHESQENHHNPYFPSGFRIYREEIKEEPSGTYWTSLDSSELKSGHFYQFEVSPYTFAGRLGQFTHEERIPVLRRAGSPYWQNFIEDVYFDRAKLFKTSVASDVLLHANHPTLNLDWDRNDDPQGALIGMAIPESYVGKPFSVTVDFSVDDKMLENNLYNHGVGLSLGDGDNSGIMVTLDFANHMLRVNEVANGSYVKSIAEINLLDDASLTVTDWTAITGINIEFSVTEIEVSINKGEEVSETYNISHTLVRYPTYLGLKSYGSEDYFPNLKHEIIGKYDRHFSSSIKDVRFKEVIPDFSSELLWVLGGSSQISSGELVGKGKSLLIDTTIDQNWIKSNAHLKVSNIYIDGSVKFTEGSEQLGHAEEPGNLVVRDSFNDRGSRMIYGDLYIGSDFSSTSTSTTYNHNVYVQGNANVGNTPSFKGDLYVNGNLTISGSIKFEGNVFVNGDLIITAGGTPDITDGNNIYYHGAVTHNYQANNSFLNRLIKSPYQPVPKQNIPRVTTPQPKLKNWYLDHGYVDVENTEVTSNIKVVTENGFTSSKHFERAENVIIVALSGDIKINGFQRLTGILYAPNGQVEIKGGHFEGIVIAPKGFKDKEGGGAVKILDLDEIIANPSDAPFMLE